MINHAESDETNDIDVFYLYGFLIVLAPPCLFMNVAFVKNLIFIISGNKYEPKLFEVIDVVSCMLIAITILALIIYIIVSVKDMISRYKKVSKAPQTDDISDIKIAQQ